VRFLLPLAAAATLAAQTPLMPVGEIRAGMQGTGRTVFSGSRIEEFGVEILGVLENAGPKQSIILARLSGDAVERTGVMQGMSGSPVYIDGKLAGAVAMSFSFSKEPIAGIRPIEEMLRIEARAPAPRARILPPAEQLLLRMPRAEVTAGAARLVEISTPVTLAGFTAPAIERFSDDLRRIGLEPRQGVLGGGSPAGALGDPSSLRPGAMISVQLLAGDMSVGADGTVTHIDGRSVYAFGHRFLSAGATDLPFARAEVLTVLPNLATSFKISAAREWMGTITADHSAAVAGELGRRAAMVPLAVRVRGRGRATDYKMQMVRDRTISPLLLQMALFSAIDATERLLGASTYSVRGRIEFEDGTPPVRLDNAWSGEAGVAAQVSLGAALPLSYCLQSGLPGLTLKSIDVEVTGSDDRKLWRLDQAWASRARARPGETVAVTALLTDEGGADVSREVRYTIPDGMPPGMLNFTIADGASANLGEYQQLVAAAPRTASEMVTFLNRLRGNSRAYVRVWRDEPGFLVGGRELNAPPPSVALILSRSQASLAAFGGNRNARLAEMEIDAGDAVVAGSRTIQVEVKE
jgi:hypothetical protein